MCLSLRVICPRRNERGRHRGGTPSRTTYRERLCALPLQNRTTTALPQGRYQRAGCTRQRYDDAVSWRRRHHGSLPRTVSLMDITERPTASFLMGKSTNGNHKFIDSGFGGPAWPVLHALRLGGWLGVADCADLAGRVYWPMLNAWKTGWPPAYCHESIRNPPCRVDHSTIDAAVPNASRRAAASTGLRVGQRRVQRQPSGPQMLFELAAGGLPGVALGDGAHMAAVQFQRL